MVSHVDAKKPAFNLQILHGSGFFSVSLDKPDLVKDFHHKGRNIFVKPRAAGTVKIIVEDDQLVSSTDIFDESEHDTKVVVELTFSDIERVTIDASRTLIEEGDEEELTVTAYDLNGNEFEEDQYQFMHFDVESNEQLQ